MPPIVNMDTVDPKINEEYEEYEEILKVDSNKNVVKRSKKSNASNSKNEKFHAKIVWRNVIIMGLLHLGAIYGFYLLLFVVKWQTVIFG